MKKLELYLLDHCIEWVGALPDNVFNCYDCHCQMGVLKQSTKFSFNESDHSSPPVFIIRVHQAGNSRLNRIIYPFSMKIMMNELVQVALSASVRSARVELRRKPITPCSCLGMVPSRLGPSIDVPWNLFGETPTIPSKNRQVG